MRRVLFVDDELNLLQASQRRLRKTFQVDIATSGEEGLDAICAKGPYAVVLSDLVMSGMDGFSFLDQAHRAAPKSVFIILTGHANLDASINALNKGYIFRFLTKPCKIHVLEKALQAGIKQYQQNTRGSESDQPASQPRLRKKVLIADDDPEVLCVLSAALQATGRFDVLCAENGQVALTLLNLVKIDFLIADKEMPEMKGLDLLKAAQERFPHMERFLMSWLPAGSLRSEMEAAGVTRCFEKPLAPALIIDALMAVVTEAPRGQIDGIATAAFLQMIEMEEKTCTLQVRSGKNLGVLFFQKGRLIGAETQLLKNEAAAYEIINWQDAVIGIEHIGTNRTISIHRPLMQILMEAALLKDEKNAAP